MNLNMDEYYSQMISLKLLIFNMFIFFFYFDLFSSPTGIIFALYGKIKQISHEIIMIHFIIKPFQINNLQHHILMVCYLNFKEKISQTNSHNLMYTQLTILF